MPDDQTATQELATLRAALKGLEPYLRHKDRCEINHPSKGGYAAWAKPRCTCGLADRLAALREGT